MPKIAKIITVVVSEYKQGSPFSQDFFSHTNQMKSINVEIVSELEVVIYDSCDV